MPPLTLGEKIRRAPRLIGEAGSDLLYGLIQPRHVPDHARPLPRIWVEVLIAVLGLAGWGLFLGYYDRVSPMASLDLRYDRDQIARMAETYVRGRGIDLDGYRRVATFGSDWMARIYLERVVGVPRMVRLVRDDQVPLWTWQVRWFVPEQQQEYRASLLPTGEVVAFVRILAEDAPGQPVDPDAARQLAEEYLKADRSYILTDWELYNVSSETLPNRVDHRLTWVKRGVEAGEGDLRISVTVQGDQVAQFYTWFRVPETFSRAYREQRSRAGVIDGLVTAAGMAFAIGGVLVVLWGLLSGLKIGWLPVGAGLIAGVVDLADSLNYFSLVDAGYDTALDYRSFIVERLTGYANSAVYQAFLVAFLVLASRWLVRAVWPRQHKLTPEPQDRWPNLARSGWRGMMLGGLMGAYLILFYAVARGLGAWSPLRTPSVDLLATPFPFVAAIWLGLLPALTEELQYRALGIGLIMRLTRHQTWLALLIPSILWGFAHTNYVTDPIWLRGVELTLSSLLLTGLFYLLFDITTTIVAHYTYNASLIAITLVRSGRPMFVITGLAAVLLGLVPGIVYAVRRLAGRHGRTSAAPRITVGSDQDRAEIPRLQGRPRIDGSVPQRLVCLRSAEGALLGYALGAIVVSSGGRTGTVVDIFVERPHRGRYYGTALYRALADWFAEQGAARVLAQVPRGNAGASTFWMVQGFRPQARVWSQALRSARDSRTGDGDIERRSPHQDK